MAEPRSWNPFARRRDARAEAWRRETLRRGHHRPVAVGTDDETDEPEVTKAPGLEGWQNDVLNYADKVPIVASGARFYEEAAKRIPVFLADADTQEAYEGAHAADAIIDILTQYREEAARAAGLRYLIGESRHTFDLDTMEWTTRGAGELYAKQSGSYVVRGRDGKEKEVEDALRVWRSFDPDRKWSDLATSSHKAMRDVLESFVIAYAEERAVSIRNALNTGLLGISEDVFLAGGGDEDAVNSEGTSESASLEARLHQMLAMTIRDPRNSANFAVPVMVTPAGKKPSECIEHISIAADRDKRKIAERIKMLKEEYATSADLPADQATGFMSDMNHWNGRLVKESSYTDYIAPKLQSIYMDAFAEIADALGIDITGVTVGLDSSQIVSPELQTDTAFKAHERGLISDQSARKHTGFTEDDAPEATVTQVPGFAYDQSNGVITIDERRAQLSLPSVPWGGMTMPEYLAAVAVGEVPDTDVDIATPATPDDPAPDADEPVDTTTDTEGDTEGDTENADATTIAVPAS